MVRNEVQSDLSLLCAEEGITKAELARRVGIGRQNLGHYGKITPVVNTGFGRVIEELGYDIEIRYIKR